MNPGMPDGRSWRAGGAGPVARRELVVDDPAGAGLAPAGSGLAPAGAGLAPAGAGCPSAGWVGVPVALARLQLELPVGAAARCSVRSGQPSGAPPLAELVEAAGFVVESARRARGRWLVDARRDRTLPDFVGPGMRMLVCGLNPSLVAADAGYGYAGATNRFWSAAVAAGIVTCPRQPLVSLTEDGVGMTDLVKRATPNADRLTPAEYRQGAARVARLVEWLRPGVVLFVGLAGWRAAIDRRAQPGLQPSPFGGMPAYVMPSTSGRNARTTPAELAAHMHRALALGPH